MWGRFTEQKNNQIFFPEMPQSKSAPTDKPLSCWRSHLGIIDVLLFPFCDGKTVLKECSGAILCLKMGHLDFNKAQFLHFSAPAEPQGGVWRHCLGWESQVPRVGMRFGCALPSCSFQTHSREIRPKVSQKGKRHEKKNKATKIPQNH